MVITKQLHGDYVAIGLRGEHQEILETHYGFYNWHATNLPEPCFEHEEFAHIMVRKEWLLRAEANRMEHRILAGLSDMAANRTAKVSLAQRLARAEAEKELASWPDEKILGLNVDKNLILWENNL